MVRRAVVVAAVLAAAAGLLVPGAATSATAAPATVTPESADDAPGGAYVPATPTRLLDTRVGRGAPRAATRAVRLQVAGVAGVPSSGVSAVVLNVTVTAPSGAGFLTVSPHGTTTTSNVNFRAGQTVAQLVTTALGDSGEVQFRASATTHVVADVVGWFTDRAHAAAGGTYRPTADRRLVDTRTSGGPVASGAARRIPLSGVPADATAVVVNLTAVRPPGGGFLTAWGGGPRPATSTLNVDRGDVRANRAIVPVAPDRSITVFASSRTDVVVDLNGWFAPSPGGTFFVATDPVRLADSRRYLNFFTSDGSGLRSGFYVSGQQGLPGTTALYKPVAVWLSATVVTSTYTGWAGFTPAPDGPASEPPPTSTSDINFGLGVTSNAVLGQMGPAGVISRTGRVAPVNNGLGEVESVIDLSGWFVAVPPSPPTGLWLAEDYTAWNASAWWTHRFQGWEGDIVQVVSSELLGLTVRYRDGTVRTWGSDGVWDTDAVDIAMSADSLLVVKRDGTVWVSGSEPELHGLPRDTKPPRYGPVPGVTDAVSVSVGEFDNARALRRDGTVLAWGREKAVSPTPMTSYGDDIVSSSASGDDGGCVAHADGSVGFDAGHTWQDTDTADHVRTLGGVGAVRVVAQDARGCYAIDTTGRLHQVDFLDTDHHEVSPVDVVIPSPPVVDVGTTHISVVSPHGVERPTFRVLTADGRLLDRVGGAWSPVEGLSGVTAMATGGPFQSAPLVAWVPGPHGDGS